MQLTTTKNKDIIWETPSGNIALKNDTVDYIEKAIDLETHSYPKGKVTDDYREDLFNYYELAIKLYCLSGNILPKGVKDDLNKIIERIDKRMREVA